jgi:hypothetical protein
MTSPVETRAPGYVPGGQDLYSPYGTPPVPEKFRMPSPFPNWQAPGGFYNPSGTPLGQRPQAPAGPRWWERAVLTRGEQMETANRALSAPSHEGIHDVLKRELYQPPSLGPMRPRTPIGPQRWSEIFGRPGGPALEPAPSPAPAGHTSADVEKAVGNLVKGGVTTGGAAKGGAVAHDFSKGQKVTVASALDPKAPGRAAEIVSITEGARPRALVRFADFTQKEVPLKLLTPMGD